MTTMTVYAVEQFGASQSKAGLASSIFIIGALFSRLLAGKYIEVIGRKKLLFGGLLLFFIATVLYFPVNNLNLLMIVRFIHGTAFGIATTAMNTAVMELIPNERRGEGTSYFSLSSTAATALGPFLGLFISQYADFNMVFVSVSIFSVLSILFSFFAVIPEANITKEQIQEMKMGLRLQDFFEIKALPISIIMFMMGIAYSGILSFLNSYAIQIHLEEAASMFFVIYATFLFISRPFTGKLLDRKGDNIVVYPALFLFAISLILLSQAENGIVLLLTGALVALGYGTMMSSGQAIAVKEAPKHRIGLALSTFFIFIDGGIGVGPFFIGLLIPHIGYRGMYLALAAVVLSSIILYYYLHGKKVTASKLVLQESKILNR